MRKYLVIAGLACSLAASYALPSLADSAVGNSTTNPPSNPSTAALTLDQIDANKPFGDMSVDQTKSPADVYAGLSVDQRVNLQARCDLIAKNPQQFGTVPTWCITYLDWQRNNHPNND